MPNLLLLATLPWLTRSCEDCEDVNLLQRQGQKSLSMSTAGRWAILELTEYEVEGSWDWWSEGDIYAVVTPPSTWEYKSAVQYDQNAGNLNYNVYLPEDSGILKIALYDHHDYFRHDLVGTTSFNPATDCGNEEVCELSFRIFSTETVVEEVAKLKGRWFTGSKVRSHAEHCNKRGIWVAFEEVTREKSKYTLQSVQADAIETDLLYAKTGSVFPESLHGIHWMDQRAISLRNGSYPEDPNYTHVCDLAAEEVFVHFGEAAWDPHTKCVTGVRQYSGGPLSGHWAWLDQGGKTSDQWENGNGWHMKYDFCFRDEEMTFIDVLIRISVSRVISDMLGLPGLFPPHVEVTVPTWLNGVSMVKTPFGWDRLTTIGPSWLRNVIRAALQSSVIQSVFGMGTGLGGEFVSGGLECHYPLLRIVDGDGNRTRFYQDYLLYVNNGTSCAEASFDCPVNRAPGTVVLGRLSPGEAERV